MKKSFLLLGLLTCAVCLTACGSKNYEMTFEEALEIANHSDLQDILVENDNVEKSFTIVGNYDIDWTKVDANISSVSKESLLNDYRNLIKVVIFFIYIFTKAVKCYKISGVGILRIFRWVMIY